MPRWVPSWSPLRNKGGVDRDLFAVQGASRRLKLGLRRATACPLCRSDQPVPRTSRPCGRGYRGPAGIARVPAGVGFCQRPDVCGPCAWHRRPVAEGRSQGAGRNGRAWAHLQLHGRWSRRRRATPQHGSGRRPRAQNASLQHPGVHRGVERRTSRLTARPRATSKLMVTEPEVWPQNCGYREGDHDRGSPRRHARRRSSSVSASICRLKRSGLSDR